MSSTKQLNNVQTRDKAVEIRTNTIAVNNRQTILQTQMKQILEIMR